MKGDVVANGELDEKFVAEQKRRLEERRAELERLARGVREDEQERSQEYQDTQPDSGDESQNIFEREVDATLDEQFARELEDVERALEKIEDGTYGLSDASGERIPTGRLEAMPQANYTVQEQRERER